VNEQTINAFLQQYDADTLEMDSFKAVSEDGTELDDDNEL
jgi:prolyl oligopeptidase PreP (S9A serine peptidase family)